MKNVLIAAGAHGDLSSTLAASLQSNGFRVERAEIDGSTESVIDSLLDAFSGKPPEVVVVDLSMAGSCLPLLHLRRLLRSVWGDDMPPPAFVALATPLHLTAPEFNTATDDFVLPPYGLPELLARIRLQLFRKRHVDAEQTLKISDTTLYLPARQALDADGAPLPLTPREYDLLQFLATHRGRLFSRGRLIDLVWGVDFEGGERTVDIHIRRLRAKLPPRTAGLLHNQRGVGYGFAASERA